MAWEWDAAEECERLRATVRLLKAQLEAARIEQALLRDEAERLLQIVKLVQRECLLSFDTPNNSLTVSPDG